MEQDRSRARSRLEDIFAALVGALLGVVVLIAAELYRGPQHVPWGWAWPLVGAAISIGTWKLSKAVVR